MLRPGSSSSESLNVVWGTPPITRYHVPKVLVAWIAYLRKYCKIPLPQKDSLYSLAMLLPLNRQKCQIH